MTLSPTITLVNGAALPRLGLGVWQAKSGGETRQAVLWALEAGYRHVDTAAVYGNEADVGAALRESRLPREGLFVTTKVWNADQGFESTLTACRRSLERLGLDYVDLYLIHWPLTGKRVATWRALEKLRSEGLCRAIGVSNFTTRHLDELAAQSEVVPAVNQVELHPFLAQPELLAYCREKGIVVEAYSPLTHGVRLDDATVARIAAAHDRQPAQILIRWGLEHGCVSLPKSVSRERIVANAAVFDFALTAAERAELDALDEGLRTCWDPSAVL